jgi:hypothetical protein
VHHFFGFTGPVSGILGREAVADNRRDIAARRRKDARLLRLRPASGETEQEE